MEQCFLATVVGAAEPSTGEDPEHTAAGIPQTLVDVGWMSLETLRDDVQVSRVLAALELEEGG